MGVWWGYGGGWWGYGGRGWLGMVRGFVAGTVLAGGGNGVVFTKLALDSCVNSFLEMKLDYFSKPKPSAYRV